MEFGKLIPALIFEIIGTIILGVTISMEKDMAVAQYVLPFTAWIPYMLCWRISNAHLNPAFTLICILRKDYNMGVVEGILYILAQSLGFFISNFLVWWMTRAVGTLNVWYYKGDFRFSEASGMEFFGSLFFLLVHTLMLSKTTAVSHNWGINSFIVGTFYGAIVFWAMQVTGGSFNPAYGFMKEAVDSMDSGKDSSMNHIWIYLVWPFVAAIFVWGLYEFIYKKANEQLEVKN